MKLKQLDYLSRIPEKVHYKGDHTRGEIEIVEYAETIAEIANERRHHLESSNLLNYTNEADEVGIVFEDEYIIVVRDPVIFPSEKMGTYLRIFERSCPDGIAGVVMLPVRDDLIYLREIFRHATRQWELECPRGSMSKGLSPLEAAQEEISEELGLDIKDIHELGTVNPNTGLLVGPAKAYYVMLGPGEPHPHPEEEEALRKIVALTLEQVMEKIRAGEIRDGYTLSALQLAQAHNFLLFGRDQANPSNISASSVSGNRT